MATAMPIPPLISYRVLARCSTALPLPLPLWLGRLAATRTRLWRVWLPADLTAGQFSIALGEYGPRVFFTNKDAGVWVIGKPLQYRYFMPSFFHP